MSKFAESIILAQKLVEGYCTDSIFDRIYPFTTENISGYINHFDLKDKSLLTVGSSGDQIINAYFNGASSVTLMDTNILSRYYYYFKVACILTLERNEFFEFLRYKNYPKVFKDNYNAFNMNTYNKIKTTLRSLDYESFLFWDDLFNSYNPLLVRTELFSDDEERTNSLEGMNYYLRDDLMYKKCRKYIKNKRPTFIQDDVTNPRTTKTYDNIWLSNIGTYLEEYYELRHLTEDMYKLLNDNGTMLACYLYDIKEITQYDSEWFKAYDINTYKSIIQECNPKTICFEGVRALKFNDPVFTDMAILCKKKIK